MPNDPDGSQYQEALGYPFLIYTGGFPGLCRIDDGRLVLKVSSKMWRVVTGQLLLGEIVPSWDLYVSLQHRGVGSNVQQPVLRTSQEVVLNQIVGTFSPNPNGL